MTLTPKELKNQKRNNVDLKPVGDSYIHDPHLTDRQIEVLRLVQKGHESKDIADMLYIEKGTVRNHLNAIYEELGVGSRCGAVYIAQALGFLPVPGLQHIEQEVIASLNKLTQASDINVCWNISVEYVREKTNE